VSQPAYNRMGVNYSDFRRPDPRIEAAIWGALERLRSDLESGLWDEKYGHLRVLPEMDIGLRLVRKEL
jgi:hypothetical protein